MPVIILNGGSCSGKSTIAKEICRQSGDGFVRLQVDEVKRYLFTILDKKSTPREIGRPICDEILLQTAKIFLKNGKNIVIDTSFDGDDAVEIAKKHINFFNSERVVFVGVDCQLEEKLRRFRDHNNNQVRSEAVIIAQDNVFELCGEMYDCSFDTGEQAAADIASEILTNYVL